MVIELLQFVFMFSHLTGNNSFPKSLSAEEEQEMLLLYESGDEEAKNILIERNLRLVAHIVKKYNNHSKETEDLISVGTIGLIKAITTFNKSKGTKLATYAARCIDNAIWYWMTRFEDGMDRFSKMEHILHVSLKQMPHLL